MVRKRGNGPENEPAPGESSASPETSGISPEGAGAQLAGSRLSVQLDVDGRIAWERMRPDTRVRLKEALGQEGPPGNVLPFAPASGPEKFPPRLAEVLYDSLSQLFVGLAQRSGYAHEQAAVLAFTPDEKQALVPPTLAVLDKYNASLGKYQEEIVLGTLLVTILTGKLTLLRKQADILAFPPNAQAGVGSQEGK